MPDPAYEDPRWHKSTHSNPDGGGCVDVLETDQAVYVKDTKLGNKSPIFEFTPSAWVGFLDSVLENAES